MIGLIGHGACTNMQIPEAFIQRVFDRTSFSQHRFETPLSATPAPKPGASDARLKCRINHDLIVLAEPLDKPANSVSAVGARDAPDNLIDRTLAVDGG